MSKYIIAHDLGTSGNKATLFSEEGKLIASKTATYATVYAPGNRAEQNPHDWWKAIVETTQALLQIVSPAEVAGVALSGQMMGCLCVDKKGRPLRPHMLYCDQRAQEEELSLSEKIDPHHFYEITGHRISASYSIEKLMWVKKHEPEVRSSIDVIGEVTAEASRETGLQRGTPVVCGGGDGSCAGVGVGCVAPGSSYNYLGSSSWVALTVEKPIVDAERRTMNWAHVVPGLLHPSGTMQTAGASFNWMVNQLCESERAEALRSGCSVYELIDRQIADSPIGAGKLLFLPYLLGERTPRWNVNAKGAFVGLTLNHRHGDMLRAVMEGITLNLGCIVHIFRGHVPMETMTVIGGCAQNPLWQQMMADIYQAEIRIPDYLEEATSMGAAVLAGIGSGLFSDFSVTERFMHIHKTVYPIAENVEKYKKLMPVFDRAYHNLCGTYTDLADLNI